MPASSPDGRSAAAAARGAWGRDPRTASTLLILTLVAGGLDGVAFLSLAGTFVSNQTGNVLLLGMSASESSRADAVATTVSLVAFFVGAALAGRVLPAVPPGLRLPPRATAVIAAESAPIAVCALLSWLTEVSSTWLTVPLALAMGGQAALAKRVGLAYLNTGFITGSTTSTAIRSPLGDGSDRWWWYGLITVATLAAGAGAGALIADRSLPMALAVLAGAALLACGLARTGAPALRGAT